jgi:hypothetical protein
MELFKEVEFPSANRNSTGKETAQMKVKSNVNAGTSIHGE